VPAEEGPGCLHDEEEQEHRAPREVGEGPLLKQDEEEGRERELDRGPEDHDQPKREESQEEAGPEGRGWLLCPICNLDLPEEGRNQEGRGSQEIGPLEPGQGDEPRREERPEGEPERAGGDEEGDRGPSMLCREAPGEGSGEGMESGRPERGEDEGCEDERV
jgi:hypothetical protein